MIKVRRVPHTERVLVIAKTYPECSNKYGCLVCTAGINESGEWRRLYPIPWSLFFEKDPNKKIDFKKWDKIELSIQRAQDPRLESYKVRDPHAIRVVGNIEDWEERRKFTLEHMDKGLNVLKNQKRSLGIIKPKQVHDFLIKPRQKTSEGEREVLDRMIQTLLPDYSFRPPKPPFRPIENPWLGYRFACDDPSCKGHEMMCIDWEIQELYRNLKLKEGEQEAFQKTKEKALDWMLKRDLYFGVGTTWRYGTWLIISLIYPPKRDSSAEITSFM